MQNAFNQQKNKQKDANMIKIIENTLRHLTISIVDITTAWSVGILVSGEKLT